MSEYSFIRLNHKITFKNKVYKFKDPIVYDFLEFTEVLSKWEYNEYRRVFKSILGEVSEEELKLFLENIEEIIEKIIEVIYPDRWGQWWDWWKNWFFPANIDYISESYWQNPITFLKEVSINQLETMSVGKERNWNIKNSEEHKNSGILTRQLGKQFEVDAKERIRAKFAGRL